MTRVNVLLPLFQTSLRTNNSQVVSEILTQKYGITPTQVYWLDRQAEGEDVFECVVRMQGFNLTFEKAAEEVQRRKTAEETLRKLQVDIFNLVKKHEELLKERKSIIPVERLREDVGIEPEDSEVSLKIEDKSRAARETYSHTEEQMMTAIRQLTRENLKLKDAIIFYEAQLQLVKGSQPMPSISMAKPK